MSFVSSKPDPYPTPVDVVVYLISAIMNRVIKRFYCTPFTHRGCDLCASLVRPQNWPGHRWRHKGGRKFALVVQGWHRGRSDLAMDAMIAVKFWTCSKQSQKGRLHVAQRRQEEITSIAVVAEWMHRGRPRKICTLLWTFWSIWAMLLPPLYHHYASFGRPIVSIDRPLWRPLCLHSATTATLEPQ